VIIQCSCCQCGDEVIIDIPKNIYEKNPTIINGITCNDCIPENSAARDGINESIYTSIK